MARIVVHIGVHKTATTYLQQRFARNRDKLKSLGVIYPSCDGDTHHNSLAGHWIKERINPKRFGALGSGAHFDAFVEKHARQDGLVFISGEAFCRFRPSRVDMADLASRLDPFDQASVVFTIRDQPRLIQSLWTEINKKAATRGDLDKFVDRTIDTGLAFGVHTDFNALYDRVVAGFGADRVRVMSYDALCADPGGPFAVFLRFLGVAEPADRFGEPRDQGGVNVSPPPLQFELARQVTAPAAPSASLIRLADRALAISGATTLLTRDQHARIVRKFAPLNAAFVEKVRLHQPEFTFEIPPAPPGLFFRDDLTKEQVARFNAAVEKQIAMTRAISRLLPILSKTRLGSRMLSLGLGPKY